MMKPLRIDPYIQTECPNIDPYIYNVNAKAFLKHSWSIGMVEISLKSLSGGQRNPHIC